jgi:hypothetical protein
MTIQAIVCVSDDYRHGKSNGEHLILRLVYLERKYSGIIRI